MALGDSLYNGVQSLRINWFLSEWSAPTLVAIRLGLIDEYNADRKGKRTFYGPEYEAHGLGPDQTINYGFNLEQAGVKNFISSALRIFSIPAEQKNHLQRLLLHIPKNGRSMVDNIAFSGANTIDLLNWTPEDYTSLAKENLGKIYTGPISRFLFLSSSYHALGSAFTYSNAAFVLNPMHDKCWRK